MKKLKYNIIYVRITNHTQHSTMPSFIACPICKKNGVVIHDRSIQECPCCGNTARKRLNIPSQVTQCGWTTKEGVNNYYTLLAKQDAMIQFKEKSKAFIDANTDVSNSKKKQHLHTLQAVCMTVAKAKYPFIADTTKNDDIN